MDAELASLLAARAGALGSGLEAALLARTPRTTARPARGAPRARREAGRGIPRGGARRRPRALRRARAGHRGRAGGGGLRPARDPARALGARGSGVAARDGRRRRHGRGRAAARPRDRHRGPGQGRAGPRLPRAQGARRGPRRLSRAAPGRALQGNAVAAGTRREAARGLEAGGEGGTRASARSGDAREPGSWLATWPFSWRRSCCSGSSRKPPCGSWSARESNWFGDTAATDEYYLRVRRNSWGFRDVEHDPAKKGA